MFTEIIKLTPQIDRAAIGRMFQGLSQRFSNLARKFGDGMKNALKFGGVVAIVGGLVSKLLNPLEKAEEVINRILKKGADATDTAEELGTDPGKLLRLQALADAKGVDSESLRQMLGKFQGMLAKEQETLRAPGEIAGKIRSETDPEQLKVLRAQLAEAQKQVNRGGLLREYANETDTADAFFKFLQSLQGLEKSQSVLIQQQVLGEKARGKVAALFNTGPEELASILSRLPTAEKFNEAARKTNAIAGEADVLRAVRESEDFVSKSTIVKESMVRGIDQNERMKLRSEDQQLMRFDSLMTSSIAVQQLTQKFDNFVTEFITVIAPELVNGVSTLSKLASEFMPSFLETKTFLMEKFDVGIELLVDLTEMATGLWEQGSEKVTEISNSISSTMRDLQNMWADIKSSKIWRTFGGGR